MLTNLQIINFRSFRELRVPGLTRVNLFVGPNNAGKTSILEAAEILAGGTIGTLLKGPRRRGERAESWLHLAHLFHGHAPAPGSSFTLRNEGGVERWVSCEIARKAPAQSPDEIAKALAAGDLIPGSDSLRFTSHQTEPALELPFFDGKMPDLSLPEAGPPLIFMGTDGPDQQRLGASWDKVVLSPEEGKITEALKIIEPRIERLAYSSTEPPGFFLKLRGVHQRVPLGSTGDGLKRLLALALHLSSSQGGLLLIDEIDTGLYHTAMIDMWKLVVETARRLDVQVLATTHSLDCVRALAWLHETDPTLAGEVTLHRVERDLPQTVSYSAEELAIAARHHMDVR
jgi:hypothetical protein